MPETIRTRAMGWSPFKKDDENIHSSYNSLSHIDIVHRMIHDGRMFIHNDLYGSVPDNAVVMHLIQTNSYSAHIQNFTANVTGAPAIISVYENCAVDSFGTPCIVYNNNRTSDRIPSAGMFCGSVTMSNTGDLIERSLITGTKQAGGPGSDREYELITNPGSMYLMALHNVSGQAIEYTDFNMSWYEPRLT